MATPIKNLPFVADFNVSAAETWFTDTDNTSADKIKDFKFI